MLSGLAAAADVQPSDLAALTEQARSKGVVRVMISFDGAGSLQAMKSDLPALKALMAQKASALRIELGSSALQGGYWTNEVGQIGLYVDQTGLQILRSSGNARAFMPDSSSKLRLKAVDADGSLDAIERQIQTQGFADV